MIRTVKPQIPDTICLMFVRGWRGPSIAMGTPGRDDSRTAARYRRRHPHASEKRGGLRVRNNAIRSGCSEAGPVPTMLGRWLTQFERLKQPMHSSGPFTQLPALEPFNLRQRIDRRGDATTSLQSVIIHGVASITRRGRPPTTWYPARHCRMRARADRPRIRLTACGLGRRS